MSQSVTRASEPTLPAIAYQVYDDYLRGLTMVAIARQRDLARPTVKRYIDALLKEEQPARAVKRERLRAETLAKLRRVYQKAAQLLETDPENTAAMNVLVRAIREEAKLQGLYAEDVTLSVEHKGEVTLRVVYKNDWRGTAPTRVESVESVVDALPEPAPASEPEAE